MGRARRKRKEAPAFVPALDATLERLSKGDLSEYVNPADIDDREQAIGRVRRFRSSMLDRLHHNGKLTWVQWYAGDTYRNAHARAAITPSVVAGYGERTTSGEISYGLARTDSQLRARKFLRECRDQMPIESRGFMERFLIHDDLPRYGGRRAMQTATEIRRALDMLASAMRIST